MGKSISFFRVGEYISEWIHGYASSKNLSVLRDGKYISEWIRSEKIALEGT